MLLFWGASSAKVAMNVYKFAEKGDEVILLNHDISSEVEHQDIKRFKTEVSDYLNIPITFANYLGNSVETIPNQFEVCEEKKGFKFGIGTDQCTYNLKTKPFTEWLKLNFPVPKDGKRDDVVIYYGFDADEQKRIQRRSSILGQQGYYSDYPLALWVDVEFDVLEVAGILPPLTYKVIDNNNTYGNWKHANCIGCLKAGRQHWYCTYVSRNDIFERAKLSEDRIGHTIIKNISLEELEPLFEQMKNAGIPATEHIQGATFWAKVRKVLKESNNLEAKDVFEDLMESADEEKPCECVF